MRPELLRYASYLLILVLLPSSLAAAAAPSSVTESFADAKDKLSKTDEQSRDVMGALYDLNLRMKRMSRRRDILNNRLISVQGNVDSLAVSTRQLEEMIQMQRSVLSKKLRAMYMIGEESVVRAIFSSSSSHELEKMLKYLKRVSNQDYRVIKSYEKNLRLLKKKKQAMDAELQKLAQLKTKIKSQEDDLENNQKSKSKLLVRLERDRKAALKKLKGLRARAAQAQLAIDLKAGFFEKKGELESPVTAPMVRKYGMIEAPIYKYRLAHKGVSFATRQGQQISVIHDGTVTFAGVIEGYGNTVILDHNDHFYTVYSNLKEIFFQKGQAVQSGQALASSAGELYFEIRHFSDALDPLQWLQTKGKTL